MRELPRTLLVGNSYHSSFEYGVSPVSSKKLSVRLLS
jgi:hypothetical protein